MTNFKDKKNIKHFENLSLEDIEGEIWKDIPEYDGIYQCSNLGRIKSLRREFLRTSKNGLLFTTYTKECIKKQTKIQVKNSKSYVLYVSLSVNGTRKTDTVSQWIGITFISDKKINMVFQHKNKNSLDNKLDNLEQVSHSVSKKNDFKHAKRKVHNIESFRPYFTQGFKKVLKKNYETNN